MSWRRCSAARGRTTRRPGEVSVKSANRGASAPSESGQGASSDRSLSPRYGAVARSVDGGPSLHRPSASRHHPLTSCSPDGCPSQAPTVGQCVGDAARNRDAPCRRDEHESRGGAHRRARGLPPAAGRGAGASRAGRRGAREAGRPGVAGRDRGRAPCAVLPRGEGSQGPQSPGRPPVGARQAAHRESARANRPPASGDGSDRPRRHAGAPPASRAQAPVRELGPGRRALPQSSRAGTVADRSSRHAPGSTRTEPWRRS
jgi:hypothetical protein